PSDQTIGYRRGSCRIFPQATTEDLMAAWNQSSPTLKNLEAAFAGESMAHMKYLHFAGIARANGHPEVAKVFEETAAQEIKHALAHAELLYPKGLVDTARALQMAIEGE